MCICMRMCVCVRVYAPAGTPMPACYSHLRPDDSPGEVPGSQCPGALTGGRCARPSQVGGCRAGPGAVELLLAAWGFSPANRLRWESGKLIPVKDVEQCLGHNDRDLSGNSGYDYPHLQGQANQCLAGKLCCRLARGPLFLR